MTIENMKATSFKNASLEDWEKKASASLKGKPVDTLNTHTYENITLKPLYTKEDGRVDLEGEYPGAPDFRRGNEPFRSPVHTWHIANRLTYSSVEELQKKMDHALSRGQSAISFSIEPELFADTEKLTDLLASFGNRYPFSINTGHLQTPFVAALILAEKKQSGKKQASGFAASDPIADAAQEGSLQWDEDTYFKDWSDLLKDADKELPHLKTVLVNAAVYHHSGANAVQELAIAISTGAYLLQKLIENGWELKAALSKIVFHFAVGSNFFMETAKLRAARLLWNKTAEAFGALPDDRKMVLSAETSQYTKTVFDPYVNMLRTGNEAFAAVLGGIDYLHTGTFNEAGEKEDSFSERIARNTQLILKAETHLEKVVDPAGGSWYIEALTEQLAEKAWEQFLEMDSQGGMLESLKTGWVQSEIAKTAAQREEDICKRRKSIIGTNVYANLSENVKEPQVHKQQSVFFPGNLATTIEQMKEGNSIMDKLEEFSAETIIPPLKTTRLAVPYEKIRYQALRLQAKMDVGPTVGLICFGELKDHKAKADFSAGFLAAGGIHAKRSGEVLDLSSALEFVRTNQFSHYIVCGFDAEYKRVVQELTSEIRIKYPHVKLYLAGLPEQEEAETWKASGIAEFIHLGSDAVQVLSSMVEEMEGALDAKA